MSKMITNNNYYDDNNGEYSNQQTSDSLTNRPFRDMHHPIIRAMWNVDRFNPRVDEKLIELRSVLNKYNPDILCDILHETTGQPIAQATPLLSKLFILKIIVSLNFHLKTLHFVSRLF
jgi:hypothetical protein